MENTLLKLFQELEDNHLLFIAREEETEDLKTYIFQTYFPASEFPFYVAFDVDKDTGKIVDIYGKKVD